MHKDLAEVLVTKEEIKTVTEKLGKQLTLDYQDKTPIVIGLLKGAVYFMADLVREMDCPLETEFMDVSSYHGGTASTGEITIVRDIASSVEGRHVLLVEDIIDTGRTLKEVVRLLTERGAASIKIVTLLDKKEARVVDIEADYVGVEIPIKFVVGFGLDYKELYRNIPYIGVLKEEVYTD